MEEYSTEVYKNHLIRGDLHGAVDYLRHFPEQAELLKRYRERFVEARYQHYAIAPVPDGALLAYQEYFRNIFWLNMDKSTAEEKLRAALLALTNAPEANSMSLDDVERTLLVPHFETAGLHFLGGRTGEYYGPYIWRTAESRSYRVERPGGEQAYTVRLLDGFIMRSWMAYLSFDAVGTSGWADEDGVISCVKVAYNLESETFRVSLLKHEAQHTRDLVEHPGMEQDLLEYRAKLVELIYTEQRNLLVTFAAQTDPEDTQDAHTQAANRLVEAFTDRLKLPKERLEKVGINEIQQTAKFLFAENERTLP